MRVQAVHLIFAQIHNYDCILCTISFNRRLKFVFFVFFSGKFGLWLDGDLNQGRSQTCNTYANEPLSPQEDFVVKTLECWAFV